MIASSAFFVLDAILDWPVSLYDGSWSQWGQMASANGGQLATDSPWRTDVPSRSELVVYNLNEGAAPLISTVTFTGTGANDLTTAGIFAGPLDRRFRVQIDGIGSPDTFRWTKDSGVSPIVWDATLVAITGATQTLSDSIMVTFGTTTGHALNARWDFTVPTNRRAVEHLTLDGSICSARINLDGSPQTLNPAGCTPLAPNSYAASGNQIEEEDAAYFGTGGGTGGSGGGPIAPGY